MDIPVCMQLRAILEGSTSKLFDTLHAYVSPFEIKWVITRLEIWCRVFFIGEIGIMISPLKFCILTSEVWYLYNFFFVGFVLFRI